MTVAQDGSKTDSELFSSNDDSKVNIEAPPATSSASSISLGTGTMRGSVMNMINTIIGAGIVALPNAFSKTGALQAVFWLVFSGLLSVFSLHLIATLAISVGGRQTSYYAVARKAAPRAAIWIDIAVVIKCFGVGVSYLIVVGDMLTDLFVTHAKVASDSVLARRDFCIAMAVVFIAFPLALLRTMRSLRFTSMLAMVCIATIAFMIVLFFGIYAGSSAPTNIEKTVSGITLWSKNPRAFLQSLPTFVFAFSCHQNMFKIYNELGAPRSVKRVTSVGAIATVVAGVIYLTVGLLGYLTLIGSNGENADLSKLFIAYSNGPFFEHFLKKYDPHLITLLITKLALTLLVLTCYPMQLHPCRDSLRQVLRALRQSWRSRQSRMEMDRMMALKELQNRHVQGSKKSTDSVVLSVSTVKAAIDAAGQSQNVLIQGTQSPLRNTIAPMTPLTNPQGSLSVTPEMLLARERRELMRHVAVTSFLVLATFGLAISFPRFDVVLIFVGATGSNAINNLAPSYFYLCLAPPGRELKKSLAALVLCFCSLLMVSVVVNETLRLLNQ